MTFDEAMTILLEQGSVALYDARFPHWAGSLRALPPHMREGMAKWVLFGIRPGSFLTSVLEGDLFGALACADDINRNSLPAYGTFLYHFAPNECFGSPYHVDTWKGCAPQADGVQSIPDDLDKIGESPARVARHDDGDL